MGFFSKLIGGIGIGIASDMAVSFYLTNYYIFAVYTPIILIISSLLFIPRWAVTNVIASILVLIICLIVVISILRLLIRFMPKICGAIRRKIRGYHRDYGFWTQMVISSVKSSIIGEIPLLIILGVIQIAALILSLFILRKTVLKSVGEVGIFRLLIFPFTYSFDIIFRTNMSINLIGAF